ncbi:hypothetical protein BBP40_002698 [Aspergillus hancockii]|nr:hypothetical protein BBP40_002698 [Aspergillus hancockii]
MALNNDFNAKLPFIGLQEPAGITEEMGSEVSDYQRGDRVGCFNFDNVCGNTTDGAWAEYMVADARFLVKLPNDIEFKVAAPLMCAGISIYGGILRANLLKDPVEKSLEKVNQIHASDYTGLDATVLATDHPSAFDLAAALTRKHGTMVLLGQPKKGITMAYHTTIYKNIKLVGSLAADTAETQELIKSFHQNKLHVKITEWRLEEAEQMSLLRMERMSL